MSNTAVRPEISYFEYSAINELAHAHLKELGKKLRAIIVYGDIVTIGGTYDINLLEVVENWKGPRTVEYTSNFSLPLRGQLFVSFLSTSEFENWQDIQDAKVRLWVQELLLRVLRGYEIVMESPAGYASNLLARGIPTPDGRDVKRIVDSLKPPSMQE